MNPKNRIEKLEKAATREQINPELEALDFSSMTDEELREIIRGEGSTTDIAQMTDEQLRAVVSGHYKMSKDGEHEFFL